MANAPGNPLANRLPLGAVKAFFTHHVALRREGSRLKLVLESGKAPAAEPAAVSAEPLDLRAALMHADLGALLDAAPGSRVVLKQLAGIERKLQRHGVLVIHDLPLTILQPTLRQLDGLALPPLAPGVAELREILVESIALHEQLQREDMLNQPISTFLVDHKLEVKEASATDFDRVALGDDASPRHAG